MRSHKEILDILIRIEKESDVNAVTYRNIPVWPLIRVFLTYHLFHSDPAGFQSQQNNKKKYSLRYVFSYYRNNRKKLAAKKREIEQLIRSAKKAEINHVAYFGHDAERKTEFEGELIDVFSFGLKKMLPENVNMLYITDKETATLPADLRTSSMSVNVINEWVTLQNEYYEVIKNSPAGFLFSDRLVHYSAVDKAIKRECPGFLNEKDLLARIRPVFLCADELEKLFTVISPRVVFYNTFYHEKNFSAALACRKCAIPSVEIQHGQQGEFSPFDNHYTKVPSRGYECWPEYFWVFGEESKHRKDEMIKNTFHKTITGGHPWLYLWKNDKNFISRAASQYAGKKEPAGIPVILVALQPVDQPVPGFLASVVTETAGKYSWKFRFHPAMKKEEEKIKQGFSQHPCIEWDESTRLPLYLLLREADTVITLWSTVAYEAAAFGKKVILIHKNGAEIMKKDVDNGLFRVALTYNDLLQELETTYSAPGNILPFIETDEKIILKNLNQLITQN